MPRCPKCGHSYGPRDRSDTVGLREAAARLGIGKTLAYDLAHAGRPLTAGVPVHRFGTTARPVYRVAKRDLDAVLGAPQEAAS